MSQNKSNEQFGEFAICSKCVEHFDWSVEPTESSVTNVDK